jgi:hypothetical protein
VFFCPRSCRITFNGKGVMNQDLCQIASTFIYVNEQISDKFREGWVGEFGFGDVAAMVSLVTSEAGLLCWLLEKGMVWRKNAWEMYIQHTQGPNTLSETPACQVVPGWLTCFPWEPACQDLQMVPRRQLTTS